MSQDYIGRAIHTGISVYSMDESIRWYRENLGFQVVKAAEHNPPLKATIAFLQRGGYQLELFQHDAPNPLPPERRDPNSDIATIGTKHLAFLTDNMPALKNRLVENGVEIVHETCMDGEAVMFICDCNGILIEFIQPA